MLAFWPSLKFASPPLHIFQLVSSEAQVDFSRSVVPNQAFELLAPDTSSYLIPHSLALGPLQPTWLVTFPS